MPPKNHTPYQLSKGLTYTQDVPPFLRAMKSLVPQPLGLDAKRARLLSRFGDDGEEEGEEEEEEEPEDEKPTVVQLSKKHLSAANAERIARGEEIRPDTEKDDNEEGGRPQFRRPEPRTDKKRKSGEGEEKGNGTSNDVGSNDKKKRKKKKTVPVVHLNHLEEHDGEDHQEVEPKEAKQRKQSASKAIPTIRIPQYDGAIDEVEQDARPVPKKSPAVAGAGKSENNAGLAWSGLVSYYDDDEGDNEDEDVETSPRQASATALPGLLHYSVEDDSEEDVESKRSQTAILRLPRTKPAKGDLPVAKPPSSSPVTPKIPAARTVGVVSGRPTAILSTSSVPQSENSSVSSSPKNNSGAHLSPHRQRTLVQPPKNPPVILSEMRALLKPQPSDDWVIPPEPQGEPDPAVQARIEKYHTLRLQGLHYNENLQKNKKYRNPHIYSKLVEFVELDETGTNFPPEKYNPKGFDKEAYYEAIAAAQRKRAEDLAALQQSGNRSSVSFLSQQQSNRPGSGVTVEPTPSIAASIAAAKAKAAEIAAASRAKRTSKWDQPVGDAKRVRGV